MNRRRLIVTLVAMLCGPDLLPAEKSLADLTEAVRPSVVTLLVYNPEKALPGFGAGFLLAPDRVVSARHPLAGGTRAEVRTLAGEFMAVKGLLAEDRLRDVCVLELVRPIPGARTLKLGGKRLRAGDAVFTLGVPLGLEWTVSTGIISAVREVPKVGWVYQHTVQVLPGNSGGPVLNLRGEVIGLQISTIKDGQTLNFAMPAEYVTVLKPGQLIPLPDAAREVGGAFVSEINQIIDHTSLRPIQREDWPGIIPFCEAATVRQPDEPDVWFRLGLALELSGKLEGAVTNYLRTIALDPKHALAHNNLGAVYNRQSRYAEARELLQQALVLKPGLPCVWDNLAAAAIGLKQGSNAVNYAQTAVQLNPDNKDYIFNLGRACQLNGDLDKARQQCQRLESLDAKLAAKLRVLIKK